MKSIYTYIIIAIIAILSLWGIITLSQPTENDDNTTKIGPRPIPTAFVKALQTTEYREFPGEVRANKRVELAFSVPGQLIEIKGTEGRIVKKGEIIAQLDQRDYKNDLDVAKANYLDNKQRMNRTNSLLQQKIVSKSEYDKVKAAYDMAAAQMRIKEKALADTKLIAPFNGIIINRYVENHEHIQAKQPIMNIQDISLIEIVLHVPEQLVAYGGSKSLQNVSINIEADGGRWFPAEVKEFSSQANPTTNTYELTLTMQPPKDMNIFTGMTTTVRAEVKKKGCDPANDCSTIIPLSAVINDPDGKNYVWIISDTPAFPQKIEVTLGRIYENGIEIISGLKVGQRIAIAGIHSLSTTMIVRPMHSGAEGLDG